MAEKGGFIWLFYGPASLPEEQRPPIPFTSELGEQRDWGWGVGGAGLVESRCCWGGKPWMQALSHKSCESRPGPCRVAPTQTADAQQALPPHPTPPAEDPEWQVVYGEVEFEAGHASVFDNATDFVSAAGKTCKPGLGSTACCAHLVQLAGCSFDFLAPARERRECCAFPMGGSQHRTNWPAPPPFLPPVPHPLRARQQLWQR